VVLEQLARALSKRAPLSPRYDGADVARRDYSSSQLWIGVPWETARQFLSGYRTEESATRASGKLWLAYVEGQIRRSGELKAWNVVMISGEGASYDIAGVSVQGRLRAREKEIAGHSGGYHIKRLATPRDIGVDLPSTAWEKPHENAIRSIALMGRNGKSLRLLESPLRGRRLASIHS
jgi:hypothetical protein